MSNYKNEICQLFLQLADKKEKSMGLHISLATSEYPNLDFVSDKEFAHALKEYIRADESFEPNLEDYEDDSFDQDF